jgi:hypothetical protein
MTPEELKVRQEEREHCLRLIEAPILGILALAERKEQSGGDSRLFRHSITVLTDAATSVRESGTFRDAMEQKRAQPTKSWRGFQIMARKMIEADPGFWTKLMEDGKYERAGGDVECPDCRLTYYEHPEVPGFPTFHIICSGAIYKT